MKDKDCRYLLSIAIFICISLVLTYFLHEKIRYNKELLGLVANIFSILTGFLLLVITTSGDVASLTEGKSRSEKYANKKKFEIRFSRYMMLFYLYLTVLCLIFFYYMLLPPGDTSKILASKPPVTNLSLSLEFIICWLSIISFGCSFFIPIKLKQIYNEKINKR
ncbi:hypothetical protein WKE96_05710 [Edwardsiella tarda]|uniref:hypothetical protein n=1 Tax=Edwardsiella tarda TaxID=636 RepID=UPI0039BDDE2C